MEFQFRLTRVPNFERLASRLCIFITFEYRSLLRWQSLKKQNRIVFSPRCQNLQPSTTPIGPIPIEETPITPTVNTNTSNCGHQQSYEMGKTNDLVFVFEYHSQLTDAERYRVLTSDGQKESDASSYRLTKSSKIFKSMG